MISFNLIDQPWIPVVFPDGTTQALSLSRTLERASEIAEISDESPLNVVAIHRLLLAITHRVHGPTSAEAWAELWRGGTLTSPAVSGYLSQHHDRFDLFQADRPFYQDRTIDASYAHPIAGLAHELAGKAGSDLFNHGLAEATALSPAQATRLLLAHQCFAVGGLVSLEKGQSPAVYKSATAAPLTKGAVVTVRGTSLFHTLLLNLIWYDPIAGQPFPGSGPDRAGDLPRWERDAPTLGEERWPTGYLDLLTWQSRRIRLFPEVTTDGQLLVKQAAIMKGNQFPSAFTRHGKETMLAFRKAKDPKAPDPWPALTFQEDRALWRDSLALFESLDNQQERPRVLDWLSALAHQQMVNRTLTIPLEVAGLGVDRAKVLFWRRERLPLPLAYLEEGVLLASLARSLKLAEEVGMTVRTSSRFLAKLLIAPNSDQQGARQPLASDIDKLVASLAVERGYWSGLDLPFRRLLIDLPLDITDDDGEAIYGVLLLPKWAETLRTTARAALDGVAESLDSSGRSLKAVAQAQRYLGGQLKKNLDGYLTEEPASEVSA